MSAIESHQAEDGEIDETEKASMLYVFADSHLSEIFEIIDEISEFSFKQQKIEEKIERFRFLLDIYQEQPVLLEPCMQNLVDKLLSLITFVQNGQTIFDNTSRIAFIFLAHIAKVRGYKRFLTFLPHDVNHLEKVLNSLERTSKSEDLDVCYVLLLWMIILCKNPFDLSLFDATTERCELTIHRIITISRGFISMKTGRCQIVASLLLALVATREDARLTVFPSVMNSTLETFSECWKSFNEISIIGNLHLLCCIFKHGRRTDLICFAEKTLGVMDALDITSCNISVVRKLYVKLIQRLGMVFLKPKIAKWRYDRGNRSLAFNLAENKQKNNQDALKEEDEEDELNYDIPQKELEIILDKVLRSARDKDTCVRWTAAKGIGRITSRLPKELAKDVLMTILSINFVEYAGLAAWHGGCLAIAELAQRGYLMVDCLPGVMEVLLKALVFEEVQGRSALGANVRDAACYICWAFARAFKPSDLAPYVERIATSLVCVAVFDREVNIRRAASAAFQENVGRQGVFPNGIDVIDIMDYFAIGLRQNAYISVSIKIAKYDVYVKPLVEHLVFYKITHWDENIRYLAADALSLLCTFNPTILSDLVKSHIIPMCRKNPLPKRLGAMLALAASLSSLTENNFQMDSMYYEEAALIPKEMLVLSDCKTRNVGSTMIRKTMNSFMKRLSGVLSLDIMPWADWLKLLELNFCDENDEIVEGAIVAGAKFFSLFATDAHKSYLIDQVYQSYLPKLLNTRKEREREGCAALLATLPLFILKSASETSGTLAREIVDKLIFIVNENRGFDSSWACGRCACVDSITKIIKIVGFDIVGHDLKDHLLPCLLHAIDDYTVDRRGDVGRFLRESAMKSFALVLPYINEENYGIFIDRAICKIVQQSCEKIDAVRECAANVINSLLRSDVQFIAEKETLIAVYTHDINEAVINEREKTNVDDKFWCSKNMKDDDWKSSDWRRLKCYDRLAPLLNSSHYRYFALSGFAVSAGGLTEFIQKNAANALIVVIKGISTSIMDLEKFLYCFKEIFTDNYEVPRVLVCLLNTFEQILAAQCLINLESEPELSPSLNQIIDLIITKANFENNPQRHIICITLLSHMLFFNCKSDIWEKAATFVTKFLHSPYPILRRVAAEKLYESIVSECQLRDELNRMNLTNILIETEWQSQNDLDFFKELTESVIKLMNITNN